MATIPIDILYQLYAYGGFVFMFSQKYIKDIEGKNFPLVYNGY